MEQHTGIDSVFCTYGFFKKYSSGKDYIYGLSTGVICLWWMKRSPRCWMGLAGQCSRSYPGETGFLLQSNDTVKSLVHGTYKHLPVSLHPNRGITKLNIYRYMYFQKLFSLIPYKKITVSGHKRKHKCTMNSILWQSSLSNKQEYPGIDS